MRLLIQHRSHYGYPEPTTLGMHTLRLRPASHAKADVETYRLSCEQASQVRWTTDPYGNRVALATFDPGQRFAELDILVELVVEIQPVNPFDFFVDDRCDVLPFSYPDEYGAELEPFRALGDPAVATGGQFERFFAGLETEGKTIDRIVAANAAVKQRIEYVIREEPGVWTPEETLEQGRGSCRDSAMLLVACLRRMGLAARFVSGYLIQVTDEGMLPDLPKGLDHDAVDLHAWAEVYLPGGGWVGLDATSGLLCTEGHIPLATAVAPPLAAPLHGTAGEPAENVGFKMSVARLGHEPQPTAPYTDEQWRAILEVGARADERLRGLGLTLTMGGEPTFTAREGVDAPEWNSAALGGAKWRYGKALLDGLRRRLAPGGLQMHRLGKHYPGESLPRWSLELYWSPQGEALWPDHEQEIAGSAAQAEPLARAIAQRLKISDYLHPAYEDPYHFVIEEGRLPVDVDPLQADLDSPEERRRLARVLQHGLSNPVGWALPLIRQGDTWVSERWKFRGERLYLLPGDSPMGLRLPLTSLFGSPIAVLPYEAPIDVPDPRRADEQVRQMKVGGRAAPDAKQPTGSVHTALCVEYRDEQEHGRSGLHVFVPPVARVDQFVDLIGHIREAARELGVSVVVEGYPPPPGSGLNKLSVTPDPGVLEVNIPVTSDTAAYAELMQVVFDEALAAGLHSETYLIDGRQQGSGGGHHLTLGGPTPARSPFASRPDLLASLITFTQHHPSLSYLFAGLFVGPTSQAPRIDEGRHEQLYEMEIALDRAFEAENAPPWLSDLLFRNLLVDLTGNTHRSEISIDKLFDPSTPFGRQGLVELRAFEMPPHPRMAVAQMLLVRSLICAFAQQPYRAPLVRWGQALHDRFLLPYYLWRDFEDVLEFLNGAGLGFDPEAFVPFVDLRCPKVGTLQAGDVALEIRNAIEPWHVLGEEQTTTGTSRFVDSSVERIELRVEGFVPQRHAVLANGNLLPVHPTAKSGQYVGGLKFRAWAPPHSLHAHLGIHHPIHIDVVDRWSQRSLGACTYHVWHPEGRAFDTPPLTRFEAAARRSQRFTRGNHRPFPVRAVSRPIAPDAPYTLDLRRFPVDRPAPLPDEEGES